MSQNEEHFRKQVEKAELALKKHNYDYAIALYQQALLLKPQAAEERRMLHKVATLAVQEKGGNPQGGFGVKLKVIKHEATAKKLHLQKKYEEELLEIEKVLQHQPQNIGTLLALGESLEHLGYWEAASATYLEILDIDKTHVEAWKRRGTILGAHLDQPGEAIDCWEKVKTYKPDDKEAGKAIRDLSAASMVHNAEKRKAAAGGDASFRDLLKNESEAADLEKQAQIIRTDDDRKRAIQRKLHEIKQDPTNSKLYREVGAHYVELKMWDKAELAFRKALQVKPDDIYAQQRLGQLKESRFDEEIQAIKARIKRDPASDADQQLLRAKETEFLHFRLEEYDGRVKAHPTDYGLKLAYGQLLLKARKFKEAIGQFQKAVKDPKQKVLAKMGIGTCFAEENLFDMAKTQFAEALDESGERGTEQWKEIKYKLAFASEKNGDKDEALQHYQEIMADDIGYKDVAERVTNLRN